MPIPLILAMDGSEFHDYRDSLQNIAWMGCPFSPTDTWNLCTPPNTTIVLTDQYPFGSRDPMQAAATLTALNPRRVILDFQRTGDGNNHAFAKALTDALPCPVGATPEYADGSSCPVFLPPIPPHILPQEYLKPWIGREIWLEIALNACQITVTTEGSRINEFPFSRPTGRSHRDDTLHCHYTIRREQDAVHFYLYRTREDALSMLDAVNIPNVTTAVGLYQELR